MVTRSRASALTKNHLLYSLREVSRASAALFVGHFQVSKASRSLDPHRTGRELRNPLPLNKFGNSRSREKFVNRGCTGRSVFACFRAPAEVVS